MSINISIFQYSDIPKLQAIQLAKTWQRAMSGMRSFIGVISQP